MKEFLSQVYDWFFENWPYCTSVLFGFLSTLCGYLVVHLKHKNKLLTCDINKAKAKGVLVKTPDGNKYKLSDCSFVLPDGSADENLDGVADPDPSDPL